MSLFNGIIEPQPLFACYFHAVVTGYFSLLKVKCPRYTSSTLYIIPLMISLPSWPAPENIWVVCPQSTHVVQGHTTPETLRTMPESHSPTWFRSEISFQNLQGLLHPKLMSALLFFELDVVYSEILSSKEEGMTR